MDTTRIETARHHLIALHKAIIDAEKLNLERLEGRLTGAEMLRRLINDERFRWLGALTELIAQLDDADGDAAECVARAARLLASDGEATRFRTEYARLLQDSPEVVLAHASARRVLSN